MLELIKKNKYNGIEVFTFKRCYFCDFDKVIHEHHIIRKVDGGLDEANNLIELCPNHHALIHKNLYYLNYSKGFYILINLNDDNDKIFPKDKGVIFSRTLPIMSLLNAEKMGKINIKGGEIDRL